MEGSHLQSFMSSSPVRVRQSGQRAGTGAVYLVKGREAVWQREREAQGRAGQVWKRS
jgi:hypothetical protein